jgi:protein SCO1
MRQVTRRFTRLLTWPLRVARFALVPTLALAALGCDSAMRGVVIENPDPAPPLAFTAFDGTRFDIAEQKGNVVLLYFGYAHCPDVCPTTMADWARAKQALGDRADRVRWVFVSMDPDRDTPELALGYARQFDASFLGVTGTDEELESLKRAWRIAAYPEGDTRTRDYTVAHPAHTFVVDRRGRLRVLIEPGVSGEDLAKDIRKLL